MVRRETVDLSRAREIDPHVERASARPISVTTPVVTVRKQGEVEFHGSAVGIAIGDACFFVTANHVASRRAAAPLYVFGRDGLVSLGIDVTVAERQHPLIDEIDLAAFRVSGHESSWNRDAFASWHELDHAWPFPARHAHVVLGYPESLNRQARRGDELTAMSYRMLGRDALPEAYVSEGCDSLNHLMLGFDRKRVYRGDGQVTAPDQHGMSGCGAWRLGLEPDEPLATPVISAIMIEWRSKARVKHLLGTRIHVLMQALVARHRDVAATVAELTRARESASGAGSA